MPRVGLLATGGTIASRSSRTGRLATVHADDLLTAAGDLPDGLDVSTDDVAMKGSYAWESSDLLRIVRAIRTSLSAGVDGVVVTHGTDAMEETSFLSAITIDDERPVVFTGAQRPFDDPAPDGPANLRDAVNVAASRDARGRGSVICFDREVFAARGATKVDTMGGHAFDAPGRGPVMRVTGDTLVPLAPASRPHVLPVSGSLSQLPRVDIVACYAGADAALLHASRAAGAAGVVLAAFGAGNANPDIVDAVSQLNAAGVPTLICSRVHKAIVAPLYAGGGGASLRHAGAIFADDLSPWQGRLLLATALACDPADPAGYVTTVLRS